MTRSRAYSLLLALAVLLLSLGIAMPGHAAKPRFAAKPKYSAIVVDAQTGHVLHAEAADATRYPASLTKMMTLFMIFEAVDQRRVRFETEWRVSSFAAGQSPTKLGLQPGHSISVREVVLGLITKSANDAAVVAAENLAGSEEEFAARMTQRARRLGMSRTTFRNASGLPNPHQTTTAADLAKLAQAMIRNFPHHYHLFSTSQFTYAGITHHNHNRFMEWYDGADGLKTGYIHASGFNLAASATRNGRRLIGVVMGGQSPGWRDERMGEILDASFARRIQPALPETRQAGAPARPAPAASAAKPEYVALAAPPLEAAPTNRDAAGNAPIAVPRLTLQAPGATPPRASQQRPPALSRPGWAVQVGAFNEVGQARRAAENARRLAPAPLASAAIDVQKIGGSGRDANMLRARLSGLAPNAARDACRILQRHRQACFTIGPSGVAQTVAVAPVSR